MTAQPPHSHLLLLVVALAAGSTGCVTARPLGASHVDRSDVCDVQALQHLCLSIRSDAALHVEQLFDGTPPKFHQRPDPSRWLTALHQQNPPVPHVGNRLTVVSFNTGLLDLRTSDVLRDYDDDAMPLKQAPLLRTRRQMLPQALADVDADVVFLQEVWRDDDLLALQAWGDAHGYASVRRPPGWAKDGLLTLVRRSLVVGELDVEHRAYSGDGFDTAALAVHVVRRRQHIHFFSTQLGEVVLLNTHLTPFPEAYDMRMHQLRELGLDAADEDALVIVAGDMNAGVYYAQDHWQTPDGTHSPQWFANAMAIPVAFAYGGFRDAFVEGLDDDDVTLEVRLADALSPERRHRNPRIAAEVPFGAPTFCDGAPKVFSATDCNPLYFAQYAGQEAPARMDHIWLRDKERRVHTASSRLVFTDAVDAADGPVSLSDHYGVRVDLVVGRP